MKVCPGWTKLYSHAEPSLLTLWQVNGSAVYGRSGSGASPVRVDSVLTSIPTVSGPLFVATMVKVTSWPIAASVTLGVFEITWISA